LDSTELTKAIGSELCGVRDSLHGPPETRNIMNEDPAVMKGIFSYEVHACRSFLETVCLNEQNVTNCYIWEYFNSYLIYKIPSIFINTFVMLSALQTHINPYWLVCLP